MYSRQTTEFLTPDATAGRAGKQYSATLRGEKFYSLTSPNQIYYMPDCVPAHKAYGDKGQLSAA